MNIRHLKRSALRTLAAACVALTAAGGAGAQTAQQPTPDQVKAAVQKQLGQRGSVKSVAPTPVPGLFEVNLGQQLIYTDATGRYILVGELQDLQTDENLTENRMQDLNRIRWADLPLSQAIVWKNGDGSRKMAVFSDPNCGYCKRLEQTLQKINNVTVYTFLMPILSPDSETKSQQIWCAKDRTKVYLDWMLRGTVPMGPASCATPLEKNVALGKSLNVRGTPAIFFTDGTRIPGAASEQVIERKLASLR